MASPRLSNSVGLAPAFGSAWLAIGRQATSGNSHHGFAEEVKYRNWTINAGGCQAATNLLEVGSLHSTDSYLVLSSFRFASPTRSKSKLFVATSIRNKERSGRCGAKGRSPLPWRMESCREPAWDDVTRPARMPLSSSRLGRRLLLIALEVLVKKD